MKIGKHLFIAAGCMCLALLMLACQRGPQYQHYLKMNHATWDRFDQKFFEIPVEKPGKSYKISIFLKADSSFIYDEMPVYVILTTPSGEERMLEVSIPVKSKGQFTGEKSGTLWQSKKVLWEEISIPDKGTCKISIENMVPKIQTNGVDGIGIERDCEQGLGFRD
jgi:gliding motility-associated lipoprotein GldH